jgi:MSHA biogenesis protein MshL
VRAAVLLLVLQGLAACANQNALMQSPVANRTDGVDQIRQELNQVLAQKPTPPPVPASVIEALTPELDDRFATRAPEPRFDLAVHALAARDFFNSLVDGTTYNIAVHPEVSGEISLNLSDVTVEEVLTITRELYGYEFQKKGRLFKILPSGLRTQMFEINYLNVARKGGSETRVSSGQITINGGKGTDSGGSDSGSGSSDSGGSETEVVSTGTRINTWSDSDFWRTLQTTLALIVGEEDGRSVVVSPDSGIVIVRARGDELTAVRKYLQSAELIMQRQVILEAKILEVELSSGYEQGIDWTFSDVSKADALGNPVRSFDFLQQGRTIVPSNGGMFASAINFDKFTTAIDLLGTQGNVQVLSSPRIATVNNQKAVIKVGSDEYYVTDIDFESSNETNSSSTDIGLTPFFSGIALDVTPQISKEGKIILHVHPTISKVEDQQKRISVGDQQIDLPLAFSSIRESDSVITAENGQIVVIGGLIQNRSEDDNASVPFFGDLPLIGELFKQKSNSTVKTELVILLRPTVTTAQVFEDDIRDSNERFGEHRRILQSTPDTQFHD